VNDGPDQAAPGAFVAETPCPDVNYLDTDAADAAAYSSSEDQHAQWASEGPAELRSANVEYAQSCDLGQSIELAYDQVRQ